MPFHVFGYLGQNDLNEKVLSYLTITKWLTKTTALPRKFKFSRPTWERKPAVSFQGIFGTIVLSCFIFQRFWSLAFCLFFFQKRPRKRAHSLYGVLMPPHVAGRNCFAVWSNTFQNATKGNPMIHTNLKEVLSFKITNSSRTRYWSKRLRTNATRGFIPSTHRLD